MFAYPQCIAVRCTALDCKLEKESHSLLNQRAIISQKSRVPASALR